MYVTVFSRQTKKFLSLMFTMINQNSKHIKTSIQIVTNQHSRVRVLNNSFRPYTWTLKTSN